MFPDKIKGVDNVTREHGKQATRTVSRAEAHPWCSMEPGTERPSPLTEATREAHPHETGHPRQSDRLRGSLQHRKSGVNCSPSRHSENTVRKQIYKNAQES